MRRKFAARRQTLNGKSRAGAQEGITWGEILMHPCQKCGLPSLHPQQATLSPWTAPLPPLTAVDRISAILGARTKYGFG